MPWLEAQYRVTTDPARTTLAGTSLGGLAASFGAFRHPERFGNVLSQSGSYWWQLVDREQRYIAPEERGEDWLTSTFRSAAAVPVRFYLEAGTLEETVGGVSLRRSVLEFRDVLVERGYEVTHHEFNGGHAWACWRAGFADGLLSLVGMDPGGC
jgi:enterochelin esterase family protein